MRNMTPEDSIDRYVKHEMNADERAAFEQQMAASPELREQVALTRAILRSLTIQAERRKRMQLMELSFRRRHPFAPPQADGPSSLAGMTEKSEANSQARNQGEVRGGGRDHWLVPAVAGSVACLLIGWLALQPYSLAPNPSPVVCPQPVAHRQQPAYRGGMDVLAQVDSLIHNRQWQQAAALVREAQADTLMEAATSPEEQAYARQVQQVMADELQWRSVQILLGQHRRVEAIRQLRRLLQGESQHREEAQALYQDLLSH